jgi:glycosyltransferase involved in cell wall biosynthesis
MIHLFVNALAASAGAGLTYVRNVVPEISLRHDVRATILLTRQLRTEFENPPNVSFVELDVPGTARRFWQEQVRLPQLVRESGADVLLSTGNLALRRSPVPQILLSGNSLYTSADFYRDLRARGAWGLWLDTRAKAIFAKKSVVWADQTVAPSQTFADTLSRWTGREVLSIYHGFDRETFFRSEAPLPAEADGKVRAAAGSLRLLFVSHYNYYRNFESLIRALPILRDRLKGRSVRMFLTCKLEPGVNPGSYRAETAAELVRKLGVGAEVVELGAMPYHLLHRLYQASDIYVTPAYAETFAHPLVEAMACGRPIVASDLAVHREICGKSAVFFQRLSPQDLAEQVLRVASSRDMAEDLGREGLERSKAFSWRHHLDEILSLAGRLRTRRSQG